MKTNEIRKSFIEYFKSKGHSHVASSSLVPAGDPTLLFANSGMVQFKDCFLGLEDRGYKRATTCQKSLRISGKHNDLENVGRTARHHTFFEMLGNFSFGDYFKRDAILFAWEYLTEVVKLDKTRLWVTIYEKDDEAGVLWRELTDVLDGRILKCGEKDNFWAMGETGPCGPCSEIHYYIGDKPKEQSEEGFRKEDGSYLEIWNLVFMQFNRDTTGTLNPLPKPSVDTGMGLERIAAVKQGVLANYDIDLLRSIISFIEKLSGQTYQGNDYSERPLTEEGQYAIDVAMRVITDHSRAAAFLIADGVHPSSDGRGYVLRRLIRRACRHGRVLGFKAPFLFKVSQEVIRLMSEEYPELSKERESIGKIIEKEEDRFLQTLDTGLLFLQKQTQALKKKSSKVLPGDVAFLLHDTYGFPLDLTEDLLRSEGISVDHEGFSLAMEQQRERSRSARAGETELILQRSVKPVATSFVGYDFNEYESNVLGIFSKEGEVKSATEGSEVAIVTKETPFYAESGGQVGDTGSISSNSASIDVIDTQKVGGDTIVHICRVVEGSVSTGERVRLGIDAVRRNALRVHHSATHLVHLALREVLGAHVKQAGSRVTDRSLRFDFSHFEAISQSQLEEIQTIANELVRENHPVQTQVLAIEEAKQTGAVALFGEKYGSLVRVVGIGPRSKEFCGGTHASRSGDIGFISILGEGGISAGVRRIEAVAGKSALERLSNQQGILRSLGDLLKTPESDLLERVSKLVESMKGLERSIEQLEQKVNSSRGNDLSAKAKTLKDGRKSIVTRIEGASPKILRELADDLKGKLGSGCIALASESEGKAIFLIAVTDDLKQRYHAGELLKEVAKVVGSKGGGRPDLAQAGGGDPSKISEALERFEELIS